MEAARSWVSARAGFERSRTLPVGSKVLNPSASNAQLATRSQHVHGRDAAHKAQVWSPGVTGTCDVCGGRIWRRVGVGAATCHTILVTQVGDGPALAEFGDSVEEGGTELIGVHLGNPACREAGRAGARHSSLVILQSI